MNKPLLSKLSVYDSFREHEVKADSLDDFMARYYRPLLDRDVIRAAYARELQKTGFIVIGPGSSTTDQVVAYYAPNWTGRKS